MPQVACLPACAPALIVGRGRFGRHPRAKLQKIDVAEMRAWHTAHGAAFGITDEGRLLAARYGVSESAAIEVIKNQSFYDPQYDPDAAQEPVVWPVCRHPFGWWALLMVLLASSLIGPSSLASRMEMVPIVLEREDA